MFLSSISVPTARRQPVAPRSSGNYEPLREALRASVVAYSDGTGHLRTVRDSIISLRAPSPTSSPPHRNLAKRASAGSATVVNDIQSASAEWSTSTGVILRAET